MFTKSFDADRYEVRAAVIVLVLALACVFAGLSQASSAIADGSGVVPMLQSAAQNFEGS